VIDEEVERSLACAFPRSYTTYLLVLYLANCSKHINKINVSRSTLALLRFSLEFIQHFQPFYLPGFGCATMALQELDKERSLFSLLPQNKTLGRKNVFLPVTVAEY
jgi:hypothetical protein